ncbi:hypothetical protein BaRGS_00031667 [Batillaria attramentaria]|uniref:Uncharacterized protein n=1 Tax=Batillaria attramentaria TaxID=370345 RepID=A0ABD0JPU3_9CAEN|nr:hypothetical protein BaRGS_007189 [Batillaria attramentaria]
MADNEPAAAAPVKTHTAFRPKNLAELVEHLKYRLMITDVIERQRSGSRRRNLLKFLMAHYVIGNDIPKINAHKKKNHKAAALTAATLKLPRRRLPPRNPRLSVPRPRHHPRRLPLPRAQRRLLQQRIPKQPSPQQKKRSSPKSQGPKATDKKAAKPKVAKKRAASTCTLT